MDFSFVSVDAGLQRKQSQSSGASGQQQPSGSAGGGAQAPARPGIAIPSFREVQQAERQRAAAPILFRASNSAADKNSVPGQQQQNQQQHVNPFAFIGGPAPSPGAPRPGLAQPLPGAPPYQQQQQPGQPAGQYRPPHQQYQQQQGQYRPPGQHSQVHAPGSAPAPFQQPYQQQQQPRHQAHPPPQPYQQQHPRPGFQQPMPPPAQQQPQQFRGVPPQGMLPTQAPQPFNPNAIIVNRRQQGNPVLKYIRNVRWQFADALVPDFLLGRDTACLFLSLRFHLLKPEYIHGRIKELQRAHRLRIILCHVDAEDAAEPLAQVTRAAIGNECTLICGWSNQECARYLETFKSYENKPAEVIQKDLGTDYLSRINAALTGVRGVNRTDVKTLGDRFGSVAGIFKASAEDLQACPGIGPTKARRLHDTFHQPFRRALTATPASATPAATAAAAGTDGSGGAATPGVPSRRAGAAGTAAAAALPPGLQEAPLDEGGGGEGSDLSGAGSEDDGDDFL